jgi:hypothetical protein
MVERVEMVGHLYIEVAMRERGTGHPLGFFRNRIGGVRL